MEMEKQKKNIWWNCWTFILGSCTCFNYIIKIDDIS
jgi:hypothetical protein